MNAHSLKLLKDAIYNRIDHILQDLEYDDININVTDDEGQTALHYSIHFDHTAFILTLLAKKGIHINSPYYYHFPALRYAVINRRIESTKLLLSHPEIDVNIQSSQKYHEGYTPLRCASRNGFTSGLQLQTTPDNWTAIKRTISLIWTNRHFCRCPFIQS